MSCLYLISVLWQLVYAVNNQRGQISLRPVIGRMIIKSAKDLRAYKLAYELATEIYKISKQWPVEERYSLTDQIRRASRSVCSNLREAWAKRRYEAHFVSKLTDADGENNETDTWLNFALDCGYISKEDHKRLSSQCAGIGRMLGAMLKNPESFLPKS
ncbi:conserved hypothetical protein [uncultured Desulfobacterium sp.]|uniref:S23 ribosomal protein n=1 Tax=uncultured Desulfobacterium sp. TaxID=201089 RepID=A0A445MZR2_9BACT|nr:conserved hypothetical protein [uncultured Desulfobacterium sp.]